ncbi:MAG: hypothetical protein Q4C61_14340, partial [Lachnospiraceae bacterium]|nr:hypothetical protein [Lachnospiraceae bacterium]
KAQDFDSCTRWFESSWPSAWRAPQNMWDGKPSEAFCGASFCTAKIKNTVFIAAGSVYNMDRLQMKITGIQLGLEKLRISDRRYG